MRSVNARGDAIWQMSINRFQQLLDDDTFHLPELREAEAAQAFRTAPASHDPPRVRVPAFKKFLAAEDTVRAMFILGLALRPDGGSALLAMIKRVGQYENQPMLLA